MEKEKKYFKIDYTLNWEGEIEIEQIQADLNALRKLEATHINLESRIIYDAPYLHQEALAFRFETEEEFSMKLKEEERRKKRQEMQELEQLRQLKLKYETLK